VRQGQQDRRAVLIDREVTLNKSTKGNIKVKSTQTKVYMITYGKEKQPLPKGDSPTPLAPLLAQKSWLSPWRRPYSRQRAALLP
jgi:topoisomerase IA-like protein